MLVDGSEGELLGGRGRGQAVEPVLEDGVDVAVGADADGQRAGTGRLEAGGRLRRSNPRQER
jgi:hypothetical protein